MTSPLRHQHHPARPVVALGERPPVLREPVERVAARDERPHVDPTTPEARPDRPVGLATDPSTRWPGTMVERSIHDSSTPCPIARNTSIRSNRSSTARVIASTCSGSATSATVVATLVAASQHIGSRCRQALRQARDEHDVRIGLGVPARDPQPESTLLLVATAARLFSEKRVLLTPARRGGERSRAPNRRRTAGG